MNTSRQNILNVYLKPGEMHIAESPTVVSTVLGSCISVTMFCRALAVGAICHGLLPECKGLKDCTRACAEGFKYVNCSLQRMIERFRLLNINLSEIEVKVFGGADVLLEEPNKGTALNVGRQNIESALQGIERAGLSLATYDVGGAFGRKILFYTHTGEIFLKRLSTWPLKQ
jgi:chemotaxis protein CheD